MFSSLFPSSPVFEHQDKKNETLNIETSLDKKSFRDSVKEIKQNTIGQLAKLGKSKFGKAALFTAALNLPACNTISKSQIDELTGKTISTEVATQLSYTNSEVGKIINNNNDFSVTGSTIHKDSIQKGKRASFDELFPASNKNQSNITENSENFIISLVNGEITEYNVLSTPLNIHQNNDEGTQAELLASKESSEKNLHNTQNSDLPETSKQTQTNTKETQQTFVSSPYSKDILVEPTKISYFAETEYATIHTGEIPGYGAVVNNYSEKKYFYVNDQKIGLNDIHNILIDQNKISAFSNKWKISTEVFEKYVVSNEEGSIYFENYLIQNGHQNEVFEFLIDQNINYRNVVEIMGELKSLKYLIDSEHGSVTDPMLLFFAHHMRFMSTQEEDYSGIKSFINSYNDFGFELNKSNVQKINNHLYFINQGVYDFMTPITIENKEIYIDQLFTQVTHYVNGFEKYANSQASNIMKPEKTMVAQNW